jgi:hypothetical protein
VERLVRNLENVISDWRDALYGIGEDEIGPLSGFHLQWATSYPYMAFWYFVPRPLDEERNHPFGKEKI